ncbi:YveK family protein [uncultured Dysosmobacter sp.]|uniref:YveK family protein n=1 Tax=uncultured Dysosmobacter sp. TaxID=2591384 RepID=UPI002630F2C9|nr:Wzz/FepE/Etk N-terminal domain-containing protein [uncultured Dysosmobacter sp.]
MKKQDNEEYLEIDLLRLMKALWRHAIAISLAMILCAGIGFSLAYWVIPAKYQASALLYVNNSSFSVGNTSISLSDLSASQTLVDTYIAILNTRLTLNDVIKQAKVDYTFEELEKMIEAKSVNGTEIFEVTVTSKDPEEAERVANTIVKVLPDKIAQVMDGSSVRTVDLAVVPEKRCSPSLQKYTILGALIGLLFSYGIVIMRDLLGEQIMSEDDLLQSYDLPVLAAIPDVLATQVGKDYGSYYAKAAERKKKT